MKKYVKKYRDAVETLEREYRAVLDTNSSHIDAYFDEKGEMLESAAVYRACNVCGSASKKPFIGPTPYIFVECVDCGFRYMDPIIDTESTSILIEGISEQRQAVLKDPKWEKRHKKMTQQIRDILAIKQGGHFLDVGCGLGRHMSLALPYFSRVEGIELDSVSRAYCLEAGLTVYGEPLEMLDLPADTYDVVLLNQVLEHLADPKGVCAEVFRVLRPGGILYIDTPNFSSVSMALFKEHCSIVAGSSHISLFSVKTALALLQSVGFSEVEARTYQTDLFPLDVLAFFLNRKGFKHRRNMQLPLYLPLYRVFHEVFEERLFRNLGRRVGSYMRIIVTKP
jgi:2-polyprenyl-3-methyl-5-hydroxy-6-metoxy-1,4-benzoquinol methylase